MIDEEKLELAAIWLAKQLKENHTAYVVDKDCMFMMLDEMDKIFELTEEEHCIIVAATNRILDRKIKTIIKRGLETKNG